MTKTASTRRLALAAALAGAALALAPSGADAQNVLRIGTVVAAPHPLIALMDDFKKQVEQRTSGGITVQLYPNAQLGG